MYRLHLTVLQMQELQSRTRQKGIAPRTRERLEMVHLCHTGWNIPKIADYLNVYHKTVRHWIKAFLSNGFDALIDQPHSGQKSAITPEIFQQVQQWLEEENHTYSTSKIVQKVQAQFAISRSVCQWSRLLRRNGFSYKRTHRTLQHKQKTQEVAKKKADLEILEKGGMLT